MDAEKKKTYKDIASLSREDLIKAMEYRRRELLRAIEVHQERMDEYARAHGFKVSGE